MRAEGAGPVAVVTAIREEFDAILAGARQVRFESGARARARIGAADVLIALCGDGPGNASRGAAAICDTFHPAVLLGAGVAGALTDSLAAGEVVAAARIRNGTGETPAPDAALLARAVGAGARRAALVTVAAPVVRAASKRGLAASLGGEMAGAVDMESASWARAAAARGLPYVILRAISDTAGEDLPDYLPDCLGADGGLRRSSVALRAILRPGTWRALARMRRRVHACGEALSVVLGRFFAEPLNRGDS